MYTIKEAASRTGIAVPTIRAWERRYRIVVPARTQAGYRLYDDDAIERLVAMRRLVDDGWQPSVAAGEIAAHGSAPARVQDATTGARVTGPDMSRRFVEVAAAMDDAGLERVLDDVLARGSFERVARDLLFPALRALGDAWASGEVSVAGEHLASNAVLRRLGLAFDAAGRGGLGGARLVVGLPPGARHELGALAFAIALRRAGVAVAYLGADLPIEDWIKASRGAAAAVVGVAVPRDRRAAREVVERLRREDPGLIVAVGGGAAEGLRPAGFAILPADLEAAVTAVQRLLHQSAGA
jgi:methanogenic corrinoid protein MtbC1